MLANSIERSLVSAAQAIGSLIGSASTASATVEQTAATANERVANEAEKAAAALAGFTSRINALNESLDNGVAGFADDKPAPAKPKRKPAQRGRKRG